MSVQKRALENRDLVVLGIMGASLIVFSRALGNAVGAQMEIEDERFRQREQRGHVMGFRIVGTGVLVYVLWQALTL